MSEHYVKKQPVDAFVWLESGVAAGQVYVLSYSPFRDGPEDVSDVLMADDQEFFPLTTVDGVQLLAKSAINAVRLEQSEVESDALAVPHLAVDVEIRGQVILSGTLLDVDFRPGLRALELLNAAPKYFPIADDERRLILVRKGAVVRAWPRDGRKVPAATTAALEKAPATRRKSSRRQ